jgi:hypothetical protein
VSAQADLRRQVSRLARAFGLTRSGLAFTPQQQAALDRCVRQVIDAMAPPPGPVAEPAPPSILESYVRQLPSAQTAVDVLVGTWVARLPPPLHEVKAGDAPLFEVEHVPWGVDMLGGIAGGRVVELGPLEGGHTYILDRLGAAEVVAVEANTRAFLKCLIAKELLGIPSARFLCGDFMAYLADHADRQVLPFDLCLASGVLYHQADPVTALGLMRKASDRLVLWTHYYNPELVSSRPDLAGRFPSAQVVERLGFRHTLYRQEYQQSLSHPGFAGGSAETSSWMTREDILGALDHVGYDVVAIGHEERDHKGMGSCFCVAARSRP